MTTGGIEASWESGNTLEWHESARLGYERQADLGWWFVRLLETAGLADEVNQPKDLPKRPERELLTQ